MSENATPSAKRGMDCAMVDREELLERYVMGRLSEEDRTAFEEHYFDCDRCFGELQALQAIRGELRRPGVEVLGTTTPAARSWILAAGLAAALLLGVAGLLWLRPISRPEQTRATQTPPPAPPAAASPGSPQLEQQKPSAIPATALEQLARVEPPPYEPLRLRGAADEATERFQRGMEHYRKGDYARAADDLRAAAELDPDAAHIHFFLGASQLILRQDEAAIDRLRATIALGDSPYLEEAHLYLAKALLRRKDLVAAEIELKKVVQLGGSVSSEAKRLLTELAKLKER